MNGLELLNQLRAAGVRVWVDGDRLKLDAPAGVLTEQMRADLAAAKGEIFSLLSSPTARAGSAVRPIVVRAHALMKCPFDDCGGSVSCKDGHCCCDGCKCWFKLKEV